MSAVKTFNPMEKSTGISVNGVDISEAAIAAEMAEYPSKDTVTAWQQAATALALKELLLQEAVAEAIDGDDEQTRIEGLLSRNIQVPIAEDVHCERYFTENPEKFRSPDLVEARHILLMAMPADADAREQARFEANRMIEEIKQDPAQFDALVQTYSACPSKETGGRLGQLSKGATVPEFEEVVFRLPTGLCEKPIETRFGVHVVWVDHRIEGEHLPYEHVKSSIARYLEDHVFRRSVSQFIQVLAGKAVIRGVDLRAAETPLVQ